MKLQRLLIASCLILMFPNTGLSTFVRSRGISSGLPSSWSSPPEERMPLNTPVKIELAVPCMIPWVALQAPTSPALIARATPQPLTSPQYALEAVRAQPPSAFLLGAGFVSGAA